MPRHRRADSSGGDASRHVAPLCGRAVEAAVDARSVYVEGAGDPGAGGAGLVEGLGSGDVGRGAWAAGVAAGGAGRCDSGGGAFGGDGSLEFCDGAEDVEDQPAAGRGGVDGFGDGAEFDAAVLEVTGDREQVRQRVAEAVQPPHHEHVTAGGVVEQSGQLGAIVASTRHSVGPDSFGSGLRQCLCLHVGGLVQRRNAGISEQRHR